MTSLRAAPELLVAHWLNAKAPLSLAAMRGRVILVVAFQMLCPGCVSTGLPQAQRVRATFAETDVAVIGLHTVFEHHAAQGSKEALAAFLHEYRINFPVGMDAASADGGAPQTMRLYQMQGTPTTILIDRAGRLRLQRFGHIDDLALGASIATLTGEATANGESAGGDHPSANKPGCDADGCPIP